VEGKLNIVHAQGASISAAEIERADKVFEGDVGAKVLLGRVIFREVA
jgi:hypothetical protein